MFQQRDEGGAGAARSLVLLYEVSRLSLEVDNLVFELNPRLEQRDPRPLRKGSHARVPERHPVAGGRFDRVRAVHLLRPEERAGNRLVVCRPEVCRPEAP